MAVSSDGGNADICQFSPAVEGPFGAVLQALVDVHGDTTVSLVALEPTPAYYRDNYGSYPFTIPGENVAHSYWNAVSRQPDGDPAGSLAYTANIVGSTGAWAVWAERSWDLALVVSQVAEGPWRSVGVSFVQVEEALESFTEPHFKTRLVAEARSTFLGNVRTRGTLP